VHVFIRRPIATSLSGGWDSLRGSISTIVAGVGSISVSSGIIVGVVVVIVCVHLFINKAKVKEKENTNKNKSGRPIL
jgi:predicted Co/Zn/Cd cation transporter (cation efflux family)